VPSNFYKTATSLQYRLVQESSLYGIKILLTEEGDEWRTRKESTYADFVKIVAKYRTSDVLRALSVQPDTLFSPATPIEKKRVINPWAAAAIARESILSGNEDEPQHDLSTGEISELFTKFAQVHGKEPDRYDEKGVPTQDWMLKIITQMMYEQHSWQESIYEELARTATIFRGDATEHHVSVRRVIEHALGISIEDAIAAAIVIYGVVTNQHGQWNIAVLDTPGLEEVLAIVPRTSIELFATLLTTDGASFLTKSRDAHSRVKGDSSRIEQRYTFNPLTTHPIFQTLGGETLVPIPDLLYKRLAPNTLYYDGFGDAKNDFSNPFGHVISHYIGVQLNCIEGDIAVYPEFKYGPAKQRVDSVDWFVALPNCLLFIESKSLRLLLGERMGLPPLKGGYTDKLSEAIVQINTSFEVYKEGKTAEFDFLPRDRIPIGLVITSDPIYPGNTPEVRARLSSSPIIPTIVASLRDLELMATWEAGALGKALVTVVKDKDLRKQPLVTALNTIRRERSSNRLLEETMSQVPIFAWTRESPAIAQP
jgi:hypothetical protein